MSWDVRRKANKALIQEVGGFDALVKSCRYQHRTMGPGTVTLAILPMPYGAESYRCGISWCAPEDQFSRKEGRIWAVRNLLKRFNYVEAHGGPKEVFDRALRPQVAFLAPLWYRTWALIDSENRENAEDNG